MRLKKMNSDESMSLKRLQKQGCQPHGSFKRKVSFSRELLMVSLETQAIVFKVFHGLDSYFNQ